MVEPMASQHGSTLAKAASGPPTMIDNVPFRAPRSPPDTGASSTSTPRVTPVSPSSTASAGSLVVMSTTGGAGRGRGEHTVRTEHHRPNIIGVAEHGEDDVARPR